MTPSEAAQMLQVLRDSWPDDALSDDDARQAANLFGAFSRDVVAEVIADRLAADLSRPGRAELSRVLRAYAGTPSKDPQPKLTTAPSRPWITDLEPAPPIAPDISERVAELRATVLRAEVTCGCDLSNPKRQEIPADPAWMHKRGCVFWTAERDWRPERAVVDRENLRVVPPEVYAAADEGRRMFQANRRARLDAAK